MSNYELIIELSNLLKSIYNLIYCYNVKDTHWHLHTLSKPHNSSFITLDGCFTPEKTRNPVRRVFLYPKNEGVNKNLLFLWTQEYHYILPDNNTLNVYRPFSIYPNDIDTNIGRWQYIQKPVVRVLNF